MNDNQANYHHNHTRPYVMHVTWHVYALKLAGALVDVIICPPFIYTRDSACTLDPAMHQDRRVISREIGVDARLLWRFERLSLRRSAFDWDLRVILKSIASVRARLFPIFVNKWFSDLVRSTQDTLCNMSKALANLFSTLEQNKSALRIRPLMLEFRVES
jgi:hypothetical protein